MGHRVGFWRLKVDQGRASGESKVGPSFPNLPKLPVPFVSVDTVYVV